MFKSLFKKDKAETKTDNNIPAPANQKRYDDPATDSLMRAIAEAKKTRPMIGVTMGADELNKRLIDRFNKGGNGVHVESLLTLLSALAGFSCQMAIREKARLEGNLTAKGCFFEVDTGDGKKFFFGDALNKPLAEDKNSVCGIILGGIAEYGKDLPDLNEIFKHTSKVVGTDEFGKPRVPEKHKSAHDTPENFIKYLWPANKQLLDMFCDHPMEWPILFAVATQKIIIQGKGVIDPKIAGILCLETAVAMSKIDPKSVNIEY